MWHHRQTNIVKEIYDFVHRSEIGSLKFEEISYDLIQGGVSYLSITE